MAARQRASAGLRMRRAVGWGNSARRCDRARKDYFVSRFLFSSNAFFAPHRSVLSGTRERMRQGETDGDSRSDKTSSILNKSNATIVRAESFYLTIGGCGC